MLLVVAFDCFLLAIEARGSRSRTVSSYRQRLAGLLRFLDEQRGKVVVGAVGAEDLDAWVVSLRRQPDRWSDHPVRAVQEGGLSEATIAGRIQAAKAFFKFLVERGHLQRSPAGHLRKLKLNNSACDKVMKVADLDAMVRAAEGRALAGKPRDLALLLFLVETGCRVGEAVSLELDHLDLDNCEGLVNGKTGPRWVDFTGRTAEALRAWLRVRPVGHNFVWAGSRGPLTTRGVYEVLRRLAEEAGVTGRFNPHSIRHLVGQSWADRVNLELVRQKLGHSDIRTTAMFYANQDRERVRAATRRLSLVNGSEFE